MTSDHSDFTDIATRCNMAVVHQKGAEIAEVTNVSQSKEGDFYEQFLECSQLNLNN